MGAALDQLKFRFVDRDGQPLATDARMEAFARKYAARWLKKHGSLPRSDHPFPNPWEPTFLIEFGDLPTAGGTQA